MTSNDDPSGKRNTLVGKSRPTKRAAEPERGGGEQISRRPESTVFDPGFADRPIAGWSGTSGIAETSDLRSTTVESQAWRSLEDASRRVAFKSDNPLIAAAGPILVLLGQLRQAPPKVLSSDIADHFAELIDDFEVALTRANVVDGDARVARYVLCETVDDIAQTLPGVESAKWLGIGMLSRFFRSDAAGSGFFDALNRVLKNPEPHCDLMELMHTCLALGFEGQYRGLPTGQADLDRIRADVYRVLRYFRLRLQLDWSPQWQPVILQGRRSRRLVPLWAVAALGFAIVAAAFVQVRSKIAQEGEAVAGEMLSLTPSAPAAVKHATFAAVLPQQPAQMNEQVEETPPTPPQAPEIPPVDVQLERVRSALADPIRAGRLTVDARGDFILIQINNEQLFQPGKARLKPEFEGLVDPLGTTLLMERGPIKIVGHTDSDKPSRTSPFKSNYDLSVARAKAVEQRLAPKLEGKVSLEVEGRGDDEPLADNDTAGGKARNRRVDLLIAREDGA